MLTTTQLQNAVESALGLLGQVGINSGPLAQLSGSSFAVANLPAGILAEVEGGQVLVSADGGGLGWFVDATPASNQECQVGSPGSPLLALAGGPAAGKEDLLSALFQELGAVANGGDSDLTTTELPPGQRQTETVNAIFSGLV